MITITAFLTSCQKEKIGKEIAQQVNDNQVIETLSNGININGEILSIDINLKENGESELVESKNSKKIKNYLDANPDAKFHLNEFGELSLRPEASNTNQSSHKCYSPSGTLTTTFYKHHNFNGADFAQSNTFAVSNLHTNGSGMGDEISSVRITDDKHYQDFQVIMYKHSSYGGPSLILEKSKCTYSAEYDNLKYQLRFIFGVFGWSIQGNWGDQISSIKGIYICEEPAGGDTGGDTGGNNGGNNGEGPGSIEVLNDNM